MVKNKIIIISSFTESLVNFRLDLILYLKEQGFDVYALGPDNDTKTIHKLNSIGVTFKQFYLKRNGFNPLEDIKSIKNLRNIFKEVQPDYILPYTIKPVIYSNIAKKGLPIKSINWITGVGFYGNPSKSIKEKLVKQIITIQYQFGLSNNDALVFQNTDDLQLFKDKKILRNSKVFITPGSGINLNRFVHTHSTIDPISFLFVGRLIKEKGVYLFIESAKRIKERYPNTKFVIVGGLDITNPNSITQTEIDELKSLDVVEFTGNVNNVKDYINQSSIFVLPSMYREGVPRSILEALAVGRPIITTDNVGCRETVIKDYNGILVKKNSVDELVYAMQFFCDNPEKIIEYGINSRKFAEDKFDVKIVNNIIKKAIENV
ncbi:MAG TPA: glycosyltransferase family 1 protein [Flavobacteriaceae bacterium]|nr:glycosyltransferase family 1 protein [Flavobacteriaceae bacterium]